MNRYAMMFEQLRAKSEAAFIPFVPLCFPDFERSKAIVDILVEEGADALELGIPFSDPIADGPIIQRANTRALENGATPTTCIKLIEHIREKHPALPIGLLLYANLVVANGEDKFFTLLKEAGIDSVLLADVPTIEAPPFRAAAKRAGLDYINILPPEVDVDTLNEISSTGMAYTYLLGRAGVTGTGEAPTLPNSNLLKLLKTNGCPPPLQGFGVSEPAHVTSALEAGAYGVISGSKTVSLIEEGLKNDFRDFKKLRTFLRSMKAKTKAAREGRKAA